jgi:hypothetical protein
MRCLTPRDDRWHAHAGQHLVGLSLSPIGLHCWQPGWLAAAVSVWTGCILFPTSFLLSFPFPFLFLFFYFPLLFPVCCLLLLLRLIALLPPPRVYIFFLHLFAFSFLAASVASTVFVFFWGVFFSGYIEILKVLKSKYQIIDTFNSHN